MTNYLFLFAEILKPIPLRKPFDFIPNLIPNLKIFLFVTKCPWGFVLSVTVRGNAFIAKQNRLSATARVFRTFDFGVILIHFKLKLARPLTHTLRGFRGLGRRGPL